MTIPSIETIGRAIDAIWPVLLALLAALTLFNQLVQRLPDRFARFKNVVATVTVDVVNFLLEVAGAFGRGPRKVEKPADPPRKHIAIPPGVSGIVFLAIFATAGIGVFIVGGGAGCASLREPKAPTFDLVEVVTRQVGNILAFVEPLLPPGDVKLAALKAAQAQKDFERFFALARPVLEQIAQNGEEVPQEVADQVVTGEAAAQSVQNFARAISGRNQDGSPKDGGQ